MSPKPADSLNVYWNPPPALGYELVPELGYYKVHGIKDKTIWKDSMNACEKEGSNLAIINSELEAWTVKSLISRASDAGWGHWIGVHDQYTEGDYITVFSKYLYQYVIASDN